MWLKNGRKKKEHIKLCFQCSPLEKIFTAGRKKGILGLGYQALTKYDKAKHPFVSRDWTNDPNTDGDEAVQEQIWKSANNISVCNRTGEIQFRQLHRLQITPQFGHKLEVLFIVSGRTRRMWRSNCV